MATPLTFNSPAAGSQPQNFLDAHFTQIAFLISTLVLAFFTPIEMCWGTAFGFLFQLYQAPSFKVGEPTITIDNTLYTLIGSVAALLRSTPAGAAGGLLFRAIPLFGATAIGATAYRFGKIPLNPNPSRCI